ncbi:hypothetical protein L207DRAFT_513263 [Hyaloscypha variabilis F]|uniref:Uncharacterized protein n=1 Tax=Hyaloscypha variabilis (strain UAMH 11265 / GT02V1 / F) TaxID=1149755 RepID=A0A2J6RJW2_HYAVF|nr:hypothetical protein L207DRAFT_513263 [Hyaloscypha variabilis F]
MASSTARRRLRTPPRATRTKPAISYAEPDSDSEPEIYEADSTSEKENRTPARRSRKNATPQRSTKRTRPARSSPQADESDDSDFKRTPKKRRVTSKPNTPKASKSEYTVLIEGSGVIPPWQSIPYHVLVQIFRYASHPLYDDRSFQPLPSSRWLVNTAHVCRAFAEPAFQVLYSSPPLVPMIQAHMLVDLLTTDPVSMAFKYRPKVESLQIEVDQVAAYSLGAGRGHLDLHGLIKDLPRLAALEFYHQKDMSPYRNLDDTIKWTYPESIFEALEYVDPNADAQRGDKTSVCKLKSWRWSSRLAGKKWPIEKLQEVHLKPSFSSLRKIAFVNYQIPYLKKDEEDPKYENILADSLKALPELEHLIFESSTLCNAKLLPLLPTTLRNLELINCWEIIADDLSEFLLTHGRQLRVLTLNHCQSLNLAFLPVLGEACPNLQVLRMNLTYFNLHATYRDSEPQYDQLLLPEQVPVWPSTLQTIELIQLRKWETPAAEMFFQSLLDSAGNLPDLRRLTIQAILNIGWRDRASFRDKWVGSLARVFKRVSESPNEHVSVQRAMKQLSLSVDEKKEPIGVETVDVETKRKSIRFRKGSSSNIAPAPAKEAASPPSRRSTRARQPRPGTYAESSDSEAEGPIERESRVSAREASRRAKFDRELAVLQATAGIHTPDLTSSPKPYSDSSDDDKPLISMKSKGKGKAKEIIQGMCDVVEVRIDNLRPTENQVTERDFLDAEPSGDEDWDGDHDDIGGGYAW